MLGKEHCKGINKKVRFKQIKCVKQFKLILIKVKKSIFECHPIKGSWDTLQIFEAIGHCKFKG